MLQTVTRELTGILFSLAIGIRRPDGSNGLNSDRVARPKVEPRMDTNEHELLPMLGFSIRVDSCSFVVFSIRDIKGCAALG
jgi:hypothetical protein